VNGFVGYADDGNPYALQIQVAAQIAIASMMMRSAIQFDREARGIAIEIHHILADNLLPPEM